jgi:hypothetical protein
VGGLGVAVAEQHGDDEDVPGELQGEVGADEDVVAGRLDRGQDRLELKVPISSAIGSGGGWFCSSAARFCSPPAGAVAVMSILRRSVSTSRTV